MVKTDITVDISRREYLPSFAELIDALSIDQIKEMLLDAQKRRAGEDIEKITHDIDLVINEIDLKLTARLIRIIVALAQLNVHIWYNKDKMPTCPDEYNELLKLAHQLNGTRNRLKNTLLAEVGDKSARKTNFNTDGLKGWDISI